VTWCWSKQWISSSASQESKEGESLRVGDEEEENVVACDDELEVAGTHICSPWYRPPAPTVWFFKSNKNLEESCTVFHVISCKELSKHWHSYWRTQKKVCKITSENQRRTELNKGPAWGTAEAKASNAKYRLNEYRPLFWECPPSRAILCLNQQLLNILNLTNPYLFWISLMQPFGIWIVQSNDNPNISWTFDCKFDL
jgi:hypothetical protein